YSWRHQLREFKSEYRVVALDLRGYGESDAPTHQESYKLDCLIADIKDILDSLGYSKCVLIGHDWGGMIAWLIAICYPETIRKLIVINFPHPSVFTDYILRHPAQLFRSSFYYFFQIPWFPEFMFSINDFKALKHLFTSRSTGIGRRGRRLTTDDLEAYIYVFSQPGALSGPMNHYRNIFKETSALKYKVVQKVANPFMQQTHLSAWRWACIILLGTVLVPVRVSCIAFLFIFLWPVATLTTINLPTPPTKPMKSWRKHLMKPALLFLFRMTFFFAGFLIKAKGKKATREEAPIFVTSPHSTFFDATAIVVAGLPSVVSASQNVQIPLAGKCLLSTQPVLVKHENPNSRKTTRNEILT
ncbi:hypothetical protein STEG23_002455, partial [Scotinomys teguina]